MYREAVRRGGQGVTGLAARLRRPETLTWVLVAGLFVGVLLFPEGMPSGIYATGLVFGARSALVVIGLVLVYRSSRIINFAQVQIGITGGLSFFLIVKFHLVLQGLDAVCGCSPVREAPRWAVHTEYWLAVLAGVLVSALLSLATFLLVVRRFRGAPPLVGTVATIAVASMLGWFTAVYVPDRLKSSSIQGVAGVVPPPLTWRVTVGGVVFGLPQIATVLVAVVSLAAITLFLSRNRTGVAVRAAAENDERAAMLGVNGALVTSVVWLQAGVLAGLAGVLVVMNEGGTATSAAGPQSLVVILAAMVIGGMVDLRLALAAAVGLSVLQQGFLWSFSDPGLVDTLVFAIVLAFLLLRRQATGRVDISGGTWRAAREVRPVPTELRGLPEVAKLRRRTTIAVAVVVLAFPFAVSPTSVATGTTTLVYALVGLSLLLLTGWAGLVSLGQFAFAAVGGFVVALLSGRYGLSFLLAVPAAAFAGAVVSIVVGLPALRIRGLYLAVTTLAFAVAATDVLLNQKYAGRFLSATLDRPTLFGFSTDDDRVFYYVTLFFLVLAVLSVVGMRRSRMARVLIAARDNDRAAQAFGVHVVRARLQAFAVSGALASVAGALFTYQQQGVAAGNYGVQNSLTVFLMVVIGGLGSIAGPLLGAGLVGMLTLLSPAYVAPLTGLVVVGALLVAPGGLTELVFDGRDALLRRIAIRNRIAVPSLVADGKPGWTGDERAPLRPRQTASGAAAYVPVRYRLPRERLVVPTVASTGRGAS
jgi:branched-chain amino acid transport system permease protein